MVSILGKRVTMKLRKSPPTIIGRGVGRRLMTLHQATNLPIRPQCCSETSTSLTPPFIHVQKHHLDGCIRGNKLRLAASEIGSDRYEVEVGLTAWLVGEIDYWSHQCPHNQCIKEVLDLLVRVSVFWSNFVSVMVTGTVRLWHTPGAS